MARGQPRNIAKRCPRRVRAQTLQQKIANEVEIERPRHLWRASNRVESVTEVEPATRLSIEERLRPHKIAHTPEMPRGAIPQGKRKISEEFRESGLAQLTPEVENQFFVGNAGRDGFAILLKATAQIFPPVQAHVPEKPDAVIERTGLRRSLWRWSSPKKGETESGADLRRDARGLGSAKRQKCGHAFEEMRVRSGPGSGNHSGKTAHRVSGGSPENAASNAV